MRIAACLPLLLTGCLFDAPAAPRQRRDAATPAPHDAAIAAALPDSVPAIASSPPSTPAAPPVADEPPWDGCAQHDPAPWAWRDDGPWGEDPHLVPGFGYEQERRAPKMPDADKYLHAMAASRVRAVDDGLLICEVESYSHNGVPPTWYNYKLGSPPKRPACGSDWDTFAGPDALLRFRFRDDYPISLFGPEDHWGFFISIPRVSLHAGDTLAVKMWDRDAGSMLTSAKPESKRNEYMGQGKLVFDGKLPFTLRTDFFRMRCNLMPRAAAHARAQPWIARLERGLKAAESWHPRRDEWSFGENDHASLVTSDFGPENFRYPAGFVGWDDEAIRSRLPRLEAINAADDRKRAQLAAELIAKAALPVGAPALPGGRGAMKLLAAGCGADGCALEIEVGPRAARDFCPGTVAGSGLRVGAIDDGGGFLAVPFQRRSGDAWVDCADAKWTAHNRLRAHLPDEGKLIWIGGIGKALILRAPEAAPKK